ncbi:hypothetical protein D3C80_1403750 [compost metagenome]
MDRGQQGFDLIGFGHLHLDCVPDAFFAEEELGLFQRHEDEGAIIVGGAGTEDAADAVGLFQTAQVAEGAVSAGRRIDGQSAADAQPHLIGKRLADQDVVAAVCALPEGFAHLRRQAVIDVLGCGQVLGSHAANHAAGDLAAGPEHGGRFRQRRHRDHARHVRNALQRRVTVR